MPTPQHFAAVALLWLAGVALRMPILALPAVIASIKDELQLSATEVGVLTGLPVALFAFVVISLLIESVSAQANHDKEMTWTSSSRAMRFGC